MNGVRTDWRGLGGVLAFTLFACAALLLLYHGGAYVISVTRGANASPPARQVERVQGVVTRPIPVDGGSLGAAYNGLHAYEVTHERTGKTVVLLFMDTYYGAGLTTMELPPETPKEKNADE